jgi:acyl-coenzyme A thioesterase 13
MTDEMERRFREGNPYHALLGVELLERGDGVARCRLPLTERVRGGVAGSMHGGAISALVDIVTLAAIGTVAKPGDQMAGTAELSVSYLRPALGDAVIAEARVLKAGRTLAVIDVDVTDPGGRLVAKGRVSYALRRARDEG